MNKLETHSKEWENIKMGIVKEKEQNLWQLKDNFGYLDFVVAKNYLWNQQCLKIFDKN